MNLPFVSKKAESSLGASIASVEERARQARYRFFYDVKAKYAAKKIAIGHTLNDQAETVLMRLIRGSGTSGLAGIPPCRDEGIIR